MYGRRIWSESLPHDRVSSARRLAGWNGRMLLVGGDGTLLNLMWEAVDNEIPVAGIRHGQLGFLATFSPENLSLKFLHCSEGV